MNAERSHCIFLLSYNSPKLYKKHFEKELPEHTFKLLRHSRVVIFRYILILLEIFRYRYISLLLEDNANEFHTRSRSRCYFTTDGQSFSQYVFVSETPLGPMTRFFFCRKIALLFFLGRPLWWEDGCVICSEICQWSESPRTHNYTLLSHLRLLGSLSVASYDSQGLRWKYSTLSDERTGL
jgi:hypothetical protein